MKITNKANSNVGISADETNERFDLEKANKRINRVRRDVNLINIVLVGIVIAFFVAFLFFLTDDYKYKAEMCKEYNKTLQDFKK